MSSPWAGPFARAVTSKKRTRKFWNVFFGIMITASVILMTAPFCLVISERCTYDREEIFVEYKDGVLATSVASYKVVEPGKQNVKINNLTKRVEAGDKIELTISKVNGKLIEARHQNEVVYSIEMIPTMPALLFLIVVFLPLIGVMVFLWIVVNLKNPPKKLDKLQGEMVLRFYK